MVEYFPLDIAQGDAFCNRTTERQRLFQLIENTTHCLIISPRRYGKTSLVTKVLTENQLTYARVDFFACFNSEDVEEKMLDGIAQAVNQLSSQPKRLLDMVSHFMQELTPTLVLERGGMKLTLVKKTKQVNLKKAFQGLDLIAQKNNKNLVFFIDEFQEVFNLSDSKKIEAELRDFAQFSKNIVFIFSGSSRHILSAIFEDSHRPLYMLCEKLLLGRIEGDHYRDYLKKQAQKKWQKSIDDAVISRILTLTERHSYYVNALCQRLWFESEPPTISLVDVFWQAYLREEKSRVEETIKRLSRNQQRLLVKIAKEDEVIEPMGIDFSRRAMMSAASIRQSLTVLLRSDFVYQVDGCYRVLDPLFHAVIKKG